MLFGLIVADRFTPGTIGVKIITQSADVPHGLWARGWPATAQSGFGENGPVTVLFVAINRRDESRLQRDVDDLATDAFWSIEDLRARSLQFAS